MPETQQDRGSLLEYAQSVSEHGGVQVGRPLPFGARLHGDGVNFALFSRDATRVSLALFNQAGDSAPARVIELDPERNRTGDIWHVWVGGIGAGQLYAYRVDGPYQPAEGLRFNPNKLLLDPYATALTNMRWDFGQALGYDPNNAGHDLSFSDVDDAAAMPRCIVPHESFDWKDDRPLRHPSSQTVIYETHVRGLTIHPSSGVAHPGTFRGVIEKIPYFTDLGITAVELMPVHEFNEGELTAVNPQTGARLVNYWGYSPAAFFAPKGSYSSRGGQGQQVFEFKEMVQALHRAGIEVILDVVFNHTAEGNEWGPTICFRGLDNPIYYMLAGDRRYYMNFTGTGNTLNANHPVVCDFILDALRYWVMEMHVDGFRFDLASVLGRDEYGNLLANAPLLERIAEDPILRDVKLIAEAWDAAGAYQVGSFSERRWAEWNGHYRDDIRRFWRGDDGMLGVLASRICGSQDIYQRSGKGPEASINFITCHDGFTLNDLVSYGQKHNEANGEGNRDGSDANYSNNYGVEGATDDPGINTLRRRQIKNFLLTLLVSRGVPMLLGGDEFRRTQGGNNNAYCQDNEISWYNWTGLEREQEIFRFARGMISLRRAHPVLSQEAFYAEADIKWSSPAGSPPNWWDPGARSLACLLPGSGETALYLMFNAQGQAADYVLPAPPDGGRWFRAVDTSLPHPQDLFEPGQEIPLDNSQVYTLGPQASAMLVAHA